MGFRSSVSRWLPPAVRPLLSVVRGATKFKGDYASFADAARDSAGYSADVVLERVTRAALSVQRGEAAYEQDSVLFSESSYNYPLLLQLMSIWKQRGNLHVLDFGGSLGSTYFRHRPFLCRHGSFRWSIVEQSHFVRVGQEHFQDDTLRFFSTIDACLEDSRPDVVLLSGVIQYLPDPYEFLESLIAKGIPFLIVDRTPFNTQAERDRLTVEVVDERVYPGSYPAWFFSRAHFMAILEREYRLLDEWQSDDVCSLPATYIGFAVEKR